MNKPYSGTGRNYRKLVTKQNNMHSMQLVVAETDLWISLTAGLAEDFVRKQAMEAVRELRGQLELWIKLDPNFRHSLSPIPEPANAPDIVRRMIRAGHSMGVGPFAAVAGSIAQMVAEKLALLLREHGLEENVIIENGGDIYLISKKDRVVALLPMPEQHAELAISIAAEDFPLSLCASSATIGHSLSFGQGELTVVRAKSAALADAAATAYNNRLKCADDIPRVLKLAENDAQLGIEGVFVQCHSHMGVWGKMEITAVQG